MLPSQQRQQRKQMNNLTIGIVSGKKCFPRQKFFTKVLITTVTYFPHKLFPHFHSLEELLIRKLQIKVSRFLLPFVNFTIILHV
jgi:hypothetical protein